MIKTCKFLTAIYGLIFMFLNVSLSCASDENKLYENCYSKLSEVLNCFINYDDGQYNYKAVSQNKKDDLTIREYVLSSQKWPIQNYKEIPSQIWKHKLTVYIPREIKHDTALLFVSGGYNKNIKGKDENFLSKENLDYARIANFNKAIIAEIHDVPNQYLFIEGKPKKEDQILAYTYKMVMDAPLENAYLAGHLPMAKAVIKAMDATQEVLKLEHHIEVNNFILAGFSKRGWAVWLATLEDERVKAIIPGVIDILNTQKSIDHICKTYKNGCPYALKDYKEEGITEHINSKAFTDLMQIEDPFNYLNDDYDAKYKERLAIPKYIINASGDDFFVPDSSKWYFKALPGEENYIRYLPNSMHYLRGNFISDSLNNMASVNEAINNYFFLYLNRTSLPKIKWEFNGNNIDIITSKKPGKVKLWSAFNEEERDFRYINSYTNTHFFIKKILSFLGSSLCDNCYYEKLIPVNCEDEINCKIHIPLSVKEKGFHAAFAELHYDINGVDFITTTGVNIY